ncbi:hypothetical protein ACLMAL_12650 [Nocardia sp. CWNU-33]|uniref:hypothetical protein n=1 Tax=Nocardia sp. CWNU-33 TaxID=3392117 RepID=UPI00398E4482
MATSMLAERSDRMGVAAVVSVWNVLDKAQRPQWTFTPFVNVGPLQFGMSPPQVRDAVDGILTTHVSRGYPGRESWIRFELAGIEPFKPAVTTYFDDTVGLACVVVNALAGPQVTLEGMQLVAQVPSQLEDQFLEYATTQSKEPRYSQQADPGSESLGVVIRAQRAGDAVLTRPVFVAREWAEHCCDTSEGRIPREEWNSF